MRSTCSASPLRSPAVISPADTAAMEIRIMFSLRSILISMKQRREGFRPLPPFLQFYVLLLIDLVFSVLNSLVYSVMGLCRLILHLIQIRIGLLCKLTCMILHLLHVGIGLLLHILRRLIHVGICLLRELAGLRLSLVHIGICLLTELAGLRLSLIHKGVALIHGRSLRHIRIKLLLRLLGLRLKDQLIDPGSGNGDHKAQEGNVKTDGIVETNTGPACFAVADRALND